MLYLQFVQNQLWLFAEVTLNTFYFHNLLILVQFMLYFVEVTEQKFNIIVFHDFYCTSWHRDNNTKMYILCRSIVSNW